MSIWRENDKVPCGVYHVRKGADGSYEKFFTSLIPVSLF